MNQIPSSAMFLFMALLLASPVPCLSSKYYTSNGINQMERRQPHIVFIMADDLGFNDVGFHGSNQIPTPNIDALAYSGVILNKYYVTAICTPSRSALMTGKHPIHNGMQHTVLYGAEPRGLPLSEVILPQYLNSLGYVSHIVGKWHLGHFKKEFTPLYRGFRTHTGFWTGHHDYYDHTAVEQSQWGIDVRRGLDIAYDLHGQYSTEIFTKEAVKVIERHNSSQPLFLYMAHAAVHSANPYNPLPAPDNTVARFAHIDNFNRRKYAAMLSEMDNSVGRIVEALKAAQMLQDCIIVFTTDNGGPAEGFNLNAASNWPLRGVKNTLWEGGVRGAGLIWGPRVALRGRVSRQMMHITDWLPTLYTAAGGNSQELIGIDGIDQWDPIVNDVPSKRTRVLHNIDDIYGNAALTIDKWKYVEGSTYDGKWDGWYGPSGRETNIRYDIGQILGSRSHRAITSILPRISPEDIRALRDESEVVCGSEKMTTEPRFSDCKPIEKPCLFNIEEDPCELNNIADSHPELLREMSRQLRAENATAVPPANLPLDARGDPRLWDNAWTNFGDYSFINNAAEKQLISKALEGKCLGPISICTVHESQGKTARHVFSCRSNRTPLEIYNSVPHAVVALSRHTHSFQSNPEN